MPKEFWGFILITWAMSNGLIWLLGIDIDDWKLKLILPQAVTVFTIILGIGCYLMGAE